jgi:hypothetical protein
MLAQYHVPMYITTLKRMKLIMDAVADEVQSLKVLSSSVDRCDDNDLLDKIDNLIYDVHMRDYRRSVCLLINRQQFDELCQRVSKYYKMSAEFKNDAVTTYKGIPIFVTELHDEKTPMLI